MISNSFLLSPQFFTFFKEVSQITPFPIYSLRYGYKRVG
jgi:hypothetical protein